MQKPIYDTKNINKEYINCKTFYAFPKRAQKAKVNSLPLILQNRTKRIENSYICVYVYVDTDVFISVY